MKCHLKWRFILASPKIQPFGSKQLTKENGHQNALVAQGTMFSLWLHASPSLRHTNLYYKKPFFPLPTTSFLVLNDWQTCNLLHKIFKDMQTCLQRAATNLQCCLKSNLLWTQTCSLHLLRAVGYIPKTVIPLFQKILKHGLFKLVEQNVLSRMLLILSVFFKAKGYKVLGILACNCK